eukprot:SAG25_NODE_5169_length_693_cov_1.555556_1_plen_103_part_00
MIVPPADGGGGTSGICVAHCAAVRHARRIMWQLALQGSQRVVAQIMKRLQLAPAAAEAAAQQQPSSSFLILCGPTAIRKVHRGLVWHDCPAAAADWKGSWYY